jgi:hypothetical protein
MPTGGTGGNGGVVAGGAGGIAANGGPAEAGVHPDGPLAVVGDCMSLRAAGSWEQINPPDTYAGSLALDPVRAGSIWLTAKGPGKVRGLFKSTDCGSTWTKINTGMNAKDIDMSSTWSMAIDYTDPNIIYIIGAYGAYGLLKSTNGGVDWRQMIPGGSPLAQVAPAGPSSPPVAFIGSVSMDPKKPRHLVLGTHATCKAPYDASCQAESLDGGETWNIVSVQPFGKGFLEQTGPYVLDDSSWLNATLREGLWLTRDHGKTWANVTAPGTMGATGGEYTHGPLRPAADGNYYLPSFNPGGVLQSKDGGATWTKIPGSPQLGYPVGFAMGGGHLYLGDLNGGTIYVAALDDLSKWTMLPMPAQNGRGGPMGMEYDEAHHLLYAGIWAGDGELWRMVTP